MAHSLPTLFAIALLLAMPPIVQAEEPAEIGDAWHDPRNPIVQIFKGERLDLWSLKPGASPTPPEVMRAEWPRRTLDRFVLARIEAKGLSPAPEADRRALARRVIFDLTGLQPTPEELDRFVADDRPEAYERLVEELLASPRYGEHLARLWLDVVRYSDSHGFDWDEFRPRAWLFRDYVIRSLNADKPYDRFVTEQLAGDELLTGPPRHAAEQDALLATTFLRLGPQDNSSALFNEQARSRSEWMSDLTETTGSAFLGLTFACCRCHNHKTDPISQADHYRLRAFFEPLKYADDTPIDLAATQESIRKENARLDGQIQPHEAARKELLRAAKERVRKERLAKLTGEERQLLDKNKDLLADDEKQRFEKLAKQVEPDDKQAREAFTEQEKNRDQEIEKQIGELNGRRRGFEFALLATDGGESAATHVLYQGDYRQPKEKVEPGFLSLLDPKATPIEPPPGKRTRGRRLALARWIVSPENPLAARVMANRLWQQVFGRGIVATPNDFGLAGARPTHPELLDHLAGEFVRGGWSLKSLTRQIVTSATYRQSSAVAESVRAADPENRLLARQNLRRLSAEQLRDSLLAVSGLMTSKSSGSPIWPELPKDVLQANPAFLDDNATKTKGWYPSPPAEQTCRSVYLVQKRTVRFPLLETFDLPENMVSCARRNTSTVAPQALTLLNSPLAIQAAKAFAERVLQQAGDDVDAQATAAFRLALGRSPNVEEQGLCRKLAAERSLVELCRALMNLNEFIYVD